MNKIPYIMRRGFAREMELLPADHRSNHRDTFGNSKTFSDCTIEQKGRVSWIQNRVEQAYWQDYGTRVHFDRWMVNIFKNGYKLRWHSDKVTNLAIVSIGASADFGVKSTLTAEEHWVVVDHGDLICFKPSFDSTWCHSVFNRPGVRQSLVFRLGVVNSPVMCEEVYPNDFYNHGGPNAAT